MSMRISMTYVNINNDDDNTSGLYYKTIMIIIMTIISDATIWSITYNHN